MKLNRTFIALTITILWIAGGLIYAYSMRQAFLEMSPSEFADLLGGALSPLAFLWLIVGYMQQGEELRLNTQALVLQADELRQSADQHRLLVEVTREQVAEERAYYQEERQRMAAAAEPVFLIGQIGYPLPQVPDRPIKIANSGGVARALSLVTVATDGTENRIFTLPVLETGATHEFNLPLLVLQSDTLRFNYRTMHGTRGHKNFSAAFGADNIPQFSRVEG